MKKIILSLVLAFSFTSAFAQLLLPTGNTIGTHSDPCLDIIMGTNPNTFDCSNGEQRKLLVSIPPINYSAAIGVTTRTQTVAGTGQSRGIAKAQLSTVTDYFAQGAIVGSYGQADSVDVLNAAFADRTASAVGGSFGARIYNPIGAPNTGTYIIAGVSGTLDGNITTYPTNGAVTAGYFNDIIKGSGTWAGYFEGRGYFDDNVGIGNNTPNSMLSVNTAGDNRHTVSAYSASASGGAAAIYGEGAQGAGADHVYGVFGNIESGGGYTYGVRGSALSNTPSTAGRAYGVFGQAGNATSGTNFGVWGELRGSNGGTAVLGYDRIKDGGAWGGILPTNETYAGYFYGDTHVKDRMGIGSGTLCLNALEAAVPSAGYRLFVDGGIAAKMIFVSNTGLPWCDYVFEEDYELTSLAEVEKHIEEKGHLHNISSAKEIDEQGGFELTKITVNQQEKIEEIFLHLIEMNKKVEALETENQVLKTQIAAQK